MQWQTMSEKGYYMVADNTMRSTRVNSVLSGRFSKSFVASNKSTSYCFSWWYHMFGN